jgi:hypothetical protein
MGPALHRLSLMASSAVVSVAIAIVSWKLIEEGALEMKNSCADATQRLLERIRGQVQAGLGARSGPEAERFPREEHAASLRVEG